MKGLHANLVLRMRYLNAVASKRSCSSGERFEREREMQSRQLHLLLLLLGFKAFVPSYRFRERNFPLALSPLLLESLSEELVI